MKNMQDFIQEAASVPCVGQITGKPPKMLITRIYELLNQPTFNETDIKEFFLKNGYDPTLKEMEKLKALHLTAGSFYSPRY